MEHASILHVAALTGVDQLVIASQDRAEPDARILPQTHPSDHHGVAGDPALIFRAIGTRVAESVNRHRGNSRYLDGQGTVIMPMW